MGKSLLGKLPATRRQGPQQEKFCKESQLKLIFLLFFIRNTGLKKVSTSELVS